MNVFWTLLGGAIAGIGTWFLASFVGGPVRRFYDLRREVNRCLVQYGNILRAPGLPNDFGLDIKPYDPDHGRRAEAHNTFRNLGAEMRAFANGEPLASRVVSWLGYDANKIASALIGHSNEILSVGGVWHSQVEKLLHISATE
jgi:hypothetical protein